MWVGAAPEFLFIPDADGDDRPDGPPQVLLDGWGYQDTHETLNTFTWGPDGWLYGCHGVFTHSQVGKPGTPNDQRVRINAGIWRYHPTKHVFEVFAEGTSNPWGIDFNDEGQAFITACVIPHLYHIIQGGRYQRQAGQHFNPYTYDDIKTIAAASPLDRQYASLGQQSLRRGRRRPRPCRRDDLSGRGLAREVSRAALHEQYSWCAAERRPAHGAGLGLRRATARPISCSPTIAGRRSLICSTAPTARCT